MAAKKKSAPGDIYNTACIYSLCAAAARKDPKLPAADKANLHDAYTKAAIRLLRHAFARGYQDLAHLKKDPDLDGLRDQEEFQKLMRELEVRVKTGTERKPGNGPR